MARDVMVEFVIRQAREIVQPDSDAELIGIKGNVAHIRYKRGHNPDCPECIMTPEDFRDFVLEMFAAKAPHITDVSLEVIQAQPA